MYLRRVRFAGRSFAEGAPPLTHVLIAVMPPAPAAKTYGAGLRRPCQGQACGGVLRVMARIVAARPATPPNRSTAKFSLDRLAFINYALTKLLLKLGGDGHHVGTQHPPGSR